MPTYKHGIYARAESSTNTTINTSAVGVPVIVGTAGGFGATKELPVNELKLISSWEEYVSTFGYSAPSVQVGNIDKVGQLKKHNFTLDEFAYTYFQLYNGEAAVFANVLDPSTHKKESEAVKAVTFDEKTGRAIFSDSLVIPSSLKLSYKETQESEAVEYKFNTDFKAIVENNLLYLQAIADGSGAWKVQTGKIITVDKYDVLDPSAVSSSDIIGAYNAQTGKRTGLELIKQVFQQFRLVPGVLLAPYYSKIPAIATALSALADNEEGVFQGIAVADLPTGTETVGGVSLQGPAEYSSAYSWKADKNLSYENLVLCWPAVCTDGVFYNMSPHFVGVMVATDETQDGYPNVSPSNQAAKITGMKRADGESVWLTHAQANQLNLADGIVTCLNFLSWTMWGNRTSVYPTETDPSKNFISNVRTIRWLLNTLILNYWSRVDMPVKRVNIEGLINSANNFLNGLQNNGVILGAQVYFNSADNKQEDINNGKFKIRLKWCGTPPMEVLEILQEYDASYLSTLFA